MPDYLNHENLIHISNKLKYKFYPAQRSIIREGYKSGKLCFIIQGTVDVVKIGNQPYQSYRDLYAPLLFQPNKKFAKNAKNAKKKELSPSHNADSEQPISRLMFKEVKQKYLDLKAKNPDFKFDCFIAYLINEIFQKI